MIRFEYLLAGKQNEDGVSGESCIRQVPKGQGERVVEKAAQTLKLSGKRTEQSIKILSISRLLAKYFFAHPFS